jgi:hypothetical protein
VSVVAHVRATNTKPDDLYSFIQLAASRPFRLDFVRQSARAYTNGAPKDHDGGPLGILLDDEIWNGGGALVGYQRPDGVVRAGYRYDAYVYVSARVTFVG